MPQDKPRSGRECAARVFWATEVNIAGPGRLHRHNRTHGGRKERAFGLIAKIPTVAPFHARACETATVARSLAVQFQFGI